MQVARRAAATSTALLFALGALPASAAPAAIRSAELADPAAPTVAIVAPVLDIELSTSDVEGAARVEESPEEIRVTLDSTVLFGKDSAELRSAAVGRIEEVAEELRAAGTGTLKIYGYTDDLGSAAHGLVLSRGRATAVAGVLRPLLPASDFPFDVKGLGEADPAVPNDSEANRRLNRRVELTFRPG